MIRGSTLIHACDILQFNMSGTLNLNGVKTKHQLIPILIKLTYRLGVSFCFGPRH